jgi:hypothetical protein
MMAMATTMAKALTTSMMRIFDGNGNSGNDGQQCHQHAMMLMNDDNRHDGDNGQRR